MSGTGGNTAKCLRESVFKERQTAIIQQCDQNPTAACLLSQKLRNDLETGTIREHIQKERDMEQWINKIQVAHWYKNIITTLEGSEKSSELCGCRHVFTLWKLLIHRWTKEQSVSWFSMYHIDVLKEPSMLENTMNSWCKWWELEVLLSAYFITINCIHECLLSTY